MNKDIRISVDFFQHHKTKRLRRKMGWEGVIALQQLWCYAAKHRPEGTLSGMDAEDIADVCDLEGDPQAFVQELCDIGFLEQCEEGVYQLHDWEENNPWAANARERSERARKAAQAKHRKDKDCATHAGSMPDACAEHADGTKEQGSSTAGPHAPSPSPSPSPPPEGEQSTEKRGTAEANTSAEHGQKKDDPYVCAIPTQKEDKPLRILQSKAEAWQRQFQFIDVYAELSGIEHRMGQKPPEQRWSKRQDFNACLNALQAANQKQMRELHKKDPRFDPSDPHGDKAAEADWKATQERINKLAQSKAVGGTA